MKKSEKTLVVDRKKLEKVIFPSYTVKKVIKKLQEENKSITESSKVDTSKLNLRFEV